MNGVYSVLPTPFAPDGSFDSESLRRVIDLFLEDGVSGFTALGVTSEVARIPIGSAMRFWKPAWPTRTVGYR